jgi:DNA-binding GntR family transcriptional regulator
MLGRTPAREAISRLVAEGFVNIAAKRGGTFVRKLDFPEICEILAAHQISENILANLCQFEDPNLVEDLQAIQDLYRVEVDNRRFLNITALNEQFHMRMNQSIHNSFFYEFAKSTHRHIRRLLVHLYTLEAPEISQQQEQFRRNLDEHERIIDALRRKDRKTLVALLPDHARATQDRFMWILQKQSVAPFEISFKPLTQTLVPPSDPGAPAAAKAAKPVRKPARP